MPFSLIDCHTHLTHEAFSTDEKAVLERAWQAGLEGIAVVGEDFQENLEVLNFCSKDKRLWPFLGWHPDRYGDKRPLPEPEELEALLKQIDDNTENILGIGEVGLDFWLTKEPVRKKEQQKAFQTLIEKAISLDLPLNVHSRSAGHYALDMLLEQKAKKVLMHAFDGKPSHALRGAEQGFVFSLPPVLLRSPQKQKLVRRLPLGALALETDSPVLASEPMKRNEPAFVVESLHCIAEIKGISPDVVRQETTKNAKRAFVLDEKKKRKKQHDTHTTL